MNHITKWIEGPTAGYTFRWVFSLMQIALAATWAFRELTSIAGFISAVMAIIGHGALAIFFWRRFTESSNEAINRMAKLRLTNPRRYEAIYGEPKPYDGGPY